MTTLASAAENPVSTTSFPRVGRSGGAFSPILGDPMSDTGNSSVSVGAANVGGVGVGVASNSNAAHSAHPRCNKRDLDVGSGQDPPPAKRISPIPAKPRQRVNNGVRAYHDQDAHHTPKGYYRLNAMPSTEGEPSSLYAGDVVAPSAIMTNSSDARVRAPLPRGRTWQTLPFRTESADSGGGGGGGGAARALPHAHEATLGINTAQTVPPMKALSTATEESTRPGRASASVNERPVSPSQPWERAQAGMMPNGSELLRRPCPVATHGGVGGLGLLGVAKQPTLTSSSSPLMMAGLYSYPRRDILQPSPAKLNNGVSFDSVGTGGGLLGNGDQRVAEALPPGGSDGSPGNPCQSMERPLGGGLRASSSWDGGCASNAPPGSGGGFIAAPACPSCGGGGGGSGCQVGVDDGDVSRKACSCKGMRPSPSSAAGLPPWMSSQSLTSEAGGFHHDTQRMADEEVFQDAFHPLFSHMLGMPAPSGAEFCGTAVAAGSGGSGGGVRGGGGEGGGNDLDILIPGEMHDIADCMRTLQQSPTHSDSHPDNDFDMSSFDGLSHNHDETQAATTGGSPDGDNQGHGRMDFEVSSSHLKGGILAGGMEMVPPVAGGEPGPRVGVDHQAVIPDLSSMVGTETIRLSPARPPPLQLWRSGTMSQTALAYAFPQPRQDGAGSADLEHRMHSAYLVVKAAASERCGADRSGGAASVAAVESAGVGGDGSSGGGGGEQRTDSLESLSAFVTEGEGGRWQTDWTAEDRAAFRRGIFAFRRDFHRIRAAFLLHKKHGNVVEYFYRRWKSDPEYPSWKCTDQLVGRRVAKGVKMPFREGGGVAKRFQTLAMRRGWVVRKDMTSGLDQMFVLRFPKMGVFPLRMERVDLGTLETMLVEGSASEEERASEADDGVRVAHSRSGVLGMGGSHDLEDTGGGGSSHQLESRSALSSGGCQQHQGMVRGRRLGWHSVDTDTSEDEGIARRGNQEGEKFPTEEAEGDVGGTSDSGSGSGPDAATDSTRSVGLARENAGGGGGGGGGSGGPGGSPSSASGMMSAGESHDRSSSSVTAGLQHPVFVPREPVQQMPPPPPPPPPPLLYASPPLQPPPFSSPPLQPHLPQERGGGPPPPFPLDAFWDVERQTAEAAAVDPSIANGPVFSSTPSGAIGSLGRTGGSQMLKPPR